MIRILFWIFAAIVICVILFGAAFQSDMTSDQNMLYWGAISYAFLAFLAFVSVFMLFDGWKKRAVGVAGKYGSKTFYRDSEPVKYWLGMFQYIVMFLLFSCATCVGVARLLPYLSKLLNH